MSANTHIYKVGESIVTQRFLYLLSIPLLKLTQPTVIPSRQLPQPGYSCHKQTVSCIPVHQDSYQRILKARTDSVFGPSCTGQYFTTITLYKPFIKALQMLHLTRLCTPQRVVFWDAGYVREFREPGKVLAFANSVFNCRRLISTKSYWYNRRLNSVLYKGRNSCGFRRVQEGENQPTFYDQNQKRNYVTSTQTLAAAIADEDWSQQNQNSKNEQNDTLLTQTATKKRERNTKGLNNQTVNQNEQLNAKQLNVNKDAKVNEQQNEQGQQNQNGQRSDVVSTTGCDDTNLIKKNNISSKNMDVIINEKNALMNGTNNSTENMHENIQDVEKEVQACQIGRNFRKDGRQQILSQERENMKQFFDFLSRQDEDVVKTVIDSVTGNRLYAQVPITDIRGVGPKNETALRSAGCVYIWQLLFIWQYRFGQDENDMNSYLKEIGVSKNRNLIVDHLKKDNSIIRNSVITLEGNIGAGKTTFLKTLCQNSKVNIKVFEEPVAEWQVVQNTVRTNDSQPQSFNLLNNFYQSPNSQAFQFQTFVLGTKLNNQAYTRDPFVRDEQFIFNMPPEQSAKALDTVHLLERSVFADRLVFVRSLHKGGQMTDQEVSIYDHWFDRLVNQQFPNLVPDGFVYLRAKAETCERRMKNRGRLEESSVSLDYLLGLHDMHEDWLHNYSLRDVDDNRIKQLLTNRRQRRFEVSRSLQGYNYAQAEYDRVQELIYEAVDINLLSRIPPIPASCQTDLAQVSFLDPSENKFLNKYPGLFAVPTLEINWNDDWDIVNDQERQRQIGGLVSDFTEWVTKYKALIRIPELFPSGFTYREQM